jgi:hypothetical protein
MKRTIIILLLLCSVFASGQVPLMRSGSSFLSKGGAFLSLTEDESEPPAPSSSQIIADHTIIDDFDGIPSNWIDSVKTMLVAFPGESHSAAYRTGLTLLEAQDATYACEVGEGLSATDQYLRVEDMGFIGEDYFFTWEAYPVGSRPTPASTMLKGMITSYNSAGHPYSVFGFAWCNDLTSSDYGNSANADPTLDVHWYGRSAGGPDGNLYWGIDDEDVTQTGNDVSLQTYFRALEEFIDHCAINSPTTKIVFTTGPVDEIYGEFIGEAGYQGHLKHEAIRAYVKADSTRILFDYADILCYDNDGTPTTQTWSGHTYPFITTTNYGDASIGHISSTGAIRLAKAQWWLLARIAGWDGVIE